MKIPVNIPLVDRQDLVRVAECIETGWVSSEGKFVHEFETEFAELLQKKYAVAVSNGSAALDIAYDIIGLDEKSEVIIPSFTIISCVAQVLRSGARPIFIDVDYETFNTTIALIKNAVTSRTKAILIPHIYGLPCDITELKSFCDENNIFLIEDIAESIGQYLRGKPCGSFGHITTVSFYANKHVTCGEGGMVLVDDEDLFHRASKKRNLCFDNSRRFVHDDLGWNYRLTNMQAALGLSQLEKLSLIRARKLALAQQYDQALCGYNLLKLPVKSTEYADNDYWVYPLRLLGDLVSFKDDIIASLGRKGVATRPFFYPLNLQPVLKKFGIAIDHSSCPVSKKLYDSGFYIPSGAGMTPEQIAYTCEAVHETLGEFCR